MFVKGRGGVPWMSLSISLLLFVSLFLAFVSCFAAWRLIYVLEACGLLEPY